MSKYYYIANGELEEIDIPHGSVTVFRDSNPHLDLKTASQVTPEDIAAIAKRRANEEARRNRLAEYPNIGDQLDAIMKWAFSETEIGLPAELKSLAGKCMSVKAKYPIED